MPGQITYRTLAGLIACMTDEQKDTYVTVEIYDGQDTECFSGKLLICGDNHDSLDDYHPVIYVDQTETEIQPWFEDINVICEAIGLEPAPVPVPDKSSPMLEPGNYSVFVLSDDNTWEQPTYRIDQPMTEHDFRMNAEMDCGGFISYGVNLDTDCPEENVRTF